MTIHGTLTERSLLDSLSAHYLARAGVAHVRKGRDRKGREGRFLAHLFRQVTDCLWLRVLVAFDLQHQLCNARVMNGLKEKK